MSDDEKSLEQQLKWANLETHLANLRTEAALRRMRVWRAEALFFSLTLSAALLCMAWATP